MTFTSNILQFQGEHRWLSNFWAVQVKLDGETYPSVEHAYMAAKTFDTTIRDKIRKMATPGEAKRYSKQMRLRPDWEQVKLQVMEDLLRQKFAQPDLREKLLATGTCEIVEGNTWGDRFWGVCQGTGQNHLGRLIMKIREELNCSNTT